MAYCFSPDLDILIGKIGLEKKVWGDQIFPSIAPGEMKSSCRPQHYYLPLINTTFWVWRTDCRVMSFDWCWVSPCFTSSLRWTCDAESWKKSLSDWPMKANAQLWLDQIWCVRTHRRTWTMRWERLDQGIGLNAQKVLSLSLNEPGSLSPPTKWMARND